jgi:predicted enzyme related to lactoylglutathione lyase
VVLPVHTPPVQVFRSKRHAGLRLEAPGDDAHVEFAQPPACEDLMSEAKRARAVGFNHVALEVGDIEEALAFYARLFAFELRGKSETMAFIDLGDQFLALQKGRRQAADDGRHFGLVVDDKEAVRRALAEAGVETLPGRFLDFRDPWGNRFEIVGYDNIQFSKVPHVLRGMGLTHLSKTAEAIEELAQKGMAPG